MLRIIFFYGLKSLDISIIKLLDWIHSTIAPQSGMGLGGSFTKKTQCAAFWYFYFGLQVGASTTCSKIKNQLFSQLVFFVAGTGLEPATFGL